MRIKNVAVIGPGVIGAAIAAQCANAGLRVCLLDEAAAPRRPLRLAQGGDSAAA